MEQVTHYVFTEDVKRSIGTLYKSFLVFVFVLAFLQPCYAQKAPHVPPLLQPWVDWVLYDKEEPLKGIPHYNDPDTLQCDWPTALERGWQQFTMPTVWYRAVQILLGGQPWKGARNLCA